MFIEHKERRINCSTLKNCVFGMSVFFPIRLLLLEIPSKTKSIDTLLNSETISKDEKYSIIKNSQFRNVFSQMITIVNSAFNINCSINFYE